jgi:hypothetical protein
LVELTSPEGVSKGHEQVASFQVAAGSLKVGEERVLANNRGKPTPLLPISVSGQILVSYWFRRIEKAAQMISAGGWTSR